MSDVLSLIDIVKKEVKDLANQILLGNTNVISNISIPHTALVLNQINQPFIIIEKNDEDALSLFKDIQLFARLTNNQKSVSFLPPPLNIELIAQRKEAVREFILNAQASLVTSLSAIETSFDVLNIDDDMLRLSVGMEIQRGLLKGWLIEKGYKEVSMVIDKGEFSQKGYIFDVFTALMNEPIRIEFFGDDIDTIKTFDIESQRSKEVLDSVTIHSTVENTSDKDIISQMLDFKDARLFTSTAHEMPYSNKIDVTFHHLPISHLGITTSETGFGGLGILPKERKDWEDLVEFLRSTHRIVFIFLQSRGQAERLKDILYDKGEIIPIVDIEKIKDYNVNRCLTVAELSQGFCLENIAFLTDKEIFGERLSRKSSKKQRLSRILLNLEDLSRGDLVVHKEHGIGRFDGIETIAIDGNRYDLINIEYTNGRLQMPVQDIHLINKYSVGEGTSIVIDSLGSDRWLKAKIKARLSAEELAQRLVNLYAERSVSEGFAFSEDTYVHREFDEFFTYQETPDQLKAIEDIKSCMQSPKPMDMLLCGDVGYGKTEVVMRAVFRAVYDKKQVAVLVPTTILAEQHYKTFKARFQGFAVNIEVTNRFKPPSERAKILKRLSRHEIDVIIGTHALLRKEIEFADLGLLVIDEEHKFGVQQKERLKELKKGVDVITLTATPIPRTLQMSLSGIREMTMIETPPEDRISVKTFVVTFNKTLIKEAIKREISRGGQVYYVYNRINMLDDKARVIKEIVPEARIGVAHGDMKDSSLEKVMLDFLEGNLDILVCTAIIGSGLDIPTVNTIIIDRADMFGLADLYQLRGRVGRSNIQSYAYLLVPEGERLGEDAIKRLQAIQEMTYLGAGFKIALKDLEIRGAGNILGKEQSGHIHRVGFDIYMELLEEAVANLKGQKPQKRIEVDINLNLTALIPESYIPDVTIRLSIYRRLADCLSIDSISDLTDELRDRFGDIPQETLNLLCILRLKCLCRDLHIRKVVEDSDIYCLYVTLVLQKDNDILPNYHLILIEVLNKLSRKNRLLTLFSDGFRVKKRDFGVNQLEDLLIDIKKEVTRRFQ